MYVFIHVCIYMLQRLLRKIFGSSGVRFWFLCAGESCNSRDSVCGLHLPSVRAGKSHNYCCAGIGFFIYQWGWVLNENVRI